MNTPKVSLLVTTYNRCEELKGTLQSIEMQDYQNIEIVIKDGGSTDGSVEYIESFKENSKFPVVFESSQDSGLYDAMNRTYILSSGDILAVMNDRYMFPEVVSLMCSAIVHEPDSVGAHADLVYSGKDGRIVRTWKMGPQRSIRTGWMPGHPTLFLKREMYERYGLYDADYQIAADYEFMVRFLKDSNNKLVYLPLTVISMYYGGTSTNSFRRYCTSFLEGVRALHRNGVYPSVAISVIRLFRVLRQFQK